MSYTIRIKAEDGQVTIESVAGHVPDGEHEISGHDAAPGTSNEHNLAVHRKAADGHTVARVGSTHFAHHHG